VSTPVSAGGQLLASGSGLPGLDRVGVWLNDPNNWRGPNGLLIHLRGPDVSTAPLLIGKISTAVQILYILGMLLLLALDVEAPHLAWAAAWACGLFTALSAAVYGGVFLRGLGHRIA